MMKIVSPYVTPPSPPQSRELGPQPSSADSVSPSPARDAVHLGPAAPLFSTAAAADASDEKPAGILAGAATALLCTASLAGLASSMMPGMISLSQSVNGPTLSTIDKQGARQLQEMPAPTFTPEQPSPDTHIIANVDATETIIEPFATNDLGQLQRTTANNPGHVTVDVQIERNAHPLGKGAVGVGLVATSVLPFFLARKLARQQKHVAVALALTAAGVAGSVMVANQLNVAHDGVGRIVSAVADARHPEGVWSGRREMHMTDGQRSSGAFSESEKVDPQQLRQFIAQHLKNYPEGNVVVSLTGHGLMYRHVSGVKGDVFGEMLGQATRDAGRPIDVLVVESCLAGNLETLNAIYPSARYAVVSEESIAAGAVGRSFEATAKATAGASLTPRELAVKLLESSKGDPGVETLAVIDLSKLPALNEAVDRLGASLVQEVEAGNVDVIRSAVNDTRVYPAEQPSTAKELAVGDLKQLAQNLIKGYAQSTSPNAQAVRDSAEQVLEQLDEAVVRSNVTDAYKGQGAISIQLPGMDVGTLENKSNVLGARGLSSYKDAKAPQSWRVFVDQMSGKMKPPTAATEASR